MRFKSIRAKLLFILAVIVGMSITVSTYILSQLVIKSYYQAYSEIGEELTRELSYDIQKDFQKENQENLIFQIAGTTSAEGVEYVIIYDKAGKLLVNSGANILANTSLDPADIISKDIRESTLITLDDKEILNITRPVRAAITEGPTEEEVLFGEGEVEQESPVIGYVRIGMDLEQVQQEVKSAIIRIVLIAIGILIVSMFLVFLSIYYSFSPIKNLMSGVYRISKGDRNFQLPARGQDELAKLSQAFNQMVRDLQQTTVSKDHVYNILQSMRESLFVIQPDFTIQTVNSAAQQLLGYSEEGLIHQPVDTLFFEGSKSNSMKRLLSKEYNQSWDATLKTKEGEKLPVLFSSAPIFNSKGNIESLVCVAQDISERKRTEEQMQRAKESAEEMSRIKSQFLANISHEIRTPMNGIIGMTELTLNTSLTSEQKDNLKIVQSSSAQMMELINEILDFSKLEAGKFQLSNNEFSLYELIENIMKNMAYSAHQKGLDFAYHIDPEVPEYYIGDENRIRQILINLLGNGIKFTDHGSVFLKVKIQKNMTKNTILLFSVRDTGVGINEAQQRKIFEAFSQVDGSMTRRHGGTGLGLTISSQLISMMSGKIAVDSKLGEGSTFRFTLNLERCSEQKKRRSQEISQHLVLGNLQVMVLEKSLIHREAIETFFNNWHIKGYFTDNFTDLVRALDSTLHHKDSDHTVLLLLDAKVLDRIPDKEIEEKLRPYIKKNACIISARSTHHEVDKKRFAKLGIHRFVYKPIRQSDLLNRIIQIKDPNLQILEDKQVEKDAKINKTEATHKKLSILLVEDNLINQKVAESILKQQNYEVTIAENGKKAIELYEKQPYDLILMDIQMPVMNGYEATKAIRKQEHQKGGHIPIIGVTAHAMKRDVEQCFAVGMDDHISKPIDPKPLFESINRLFYYQQTNQEPSKIHQP